KKVTLEVQVDTEVVRQTGRPFKVVISAFDVSKPDKVVATTSVILSKTKVNGELIIKHPKLWWPAGMGEQPLYKIHVELLDPAGNPVDSMSKRIGLRELIAVFAQ